MSKDRINLWSWHGLPWSGLRPRDKANENRTSLYAFLWVACLAAIRIASKYAGLPEWTIWPMAAVSLWCGWLFVRAFHRMLREADEMIRNIHLAGLAAGFGAGLICGLTFTILRPAAPGAVLAFFLPMMIVYVTSVILAARQAVKDEE